MADESMSIGEYLRRTRLARRLDIAEISEELHIRRDYLEALEHDQWDKLPGEVYGIGFLRSYARYLDVDADSLVSYRRRLAGQSPVPAVPKQSDPPMPRRRRRSSRGGAAPVVQPPASPPSRVSRTPNRNGSGRAVLGAALVLVALFVAGIFLFHNSPKTTNTAGAAPPSHPPAGVRSSHQKHSHSPSHSAKAPQSSSAASVTLQSNNPATGDVVYQVSGGPLDVNLAFSGLCWVQFWKNGVSQNPSGTTYNSGQTLSLSATSSVEVFVGTRTFTLTVDHQTVSIPDPSQHVLHITFNHS